MTYDAATKTATLNPNIDLATNVTYTAIVKSGSSGAKDTAGNSLAADKVWSFTTAAAPADTVPPTISSVEPANRATNVPLNTNVPATFSEAMDKATLTTATFKLVNASTGKRVRASVTPSSDGTKATLDPSEEMLAKSTTYKATISGAKDQAGNALAKKVWSFKTGKT